VIIAQKVENAMHGQMLSMCTKADTSPGCLALRDAQRERDVAKIPFGRRRRRKRKNICGSINATKLRIQCPQALVVAEQNCELGRRLLWRAAQQCEPGGAAHNRELDAAPPPIGLLDDKGNAVPRLHSSVMPPRRTSAR